MTKKTKLYETLLVYAETGKEVLVNHPTRPTLQMMQGWVGGSIEHTKIRWDGKIRSIVCNEEGLLQRLPLNKAVSEAYQQTYSKQAEFFGETTMNTIVGNVAILLNWRL